MKSLIHSQILTVHPLKFGNGCVISSHTLLSMWLLTHAGINIRTMCGFMACPEGNHAAPLPISVFFFFWKHIMRWVNPCYALGHFIALNFYDTGALLTDEFKVVIQIDLRINFAWLINMSSWKIHYIDVIMTTVASQITSLTFVYSTVYSDADQRKHQSSASLAFVWGIHRDRWIPRTKGQLRGKCFHLMTSSCSCNLFPSFLRVASLELAQSHVNLKETNHYPITTKLNKAQKLSILGCMKACGICMLLYVESIATRIE